QHDAGRPPHAPLPHRQRTLHPPARNPQARLLRSAPALVGPLHLGLHRRRPARNVRALSVPFSTHPLHHL
ncbi:hypothetical protein OF83DRAFT_1113831, partial [Amylostereum chailletii]